MVNTRYLLVALFCSTLIACASSASKNAAITNVITPNPPACIAANQVGLLSRMKNELPLLSSTDHKTWKSITIASGETKTLDIPAPKKGKPSAKGIYIHTGNETHLTPGKLYSLTIEKNTIAVHEEPSPPCPQFH